VNARALLSELFESWALIDDKGEYFESTPIGPFSTFLSRGGSFILTMAA
jgi:hypothetical protein